MSVYSHCAGVPTVPSPNIQSKVGDHAAPVCCQDDSTESSYQRIQLCHSVPWGRMPLAYYHTVTVVDCCQSLLAAGEALAAAAVLSSAAVVAAAAAVVSAAVPAAAVVAAAAVVDAAVGAQ